MSPKGIDIPAGNREGSIYHVRLHDHGESCTLRFLTDADEFYYERMHRFMVNGKYQGEKICVQSALEQPCSLCEQGDQSRFQFLAWVFERQHDYTEPGDGRKKVSLSGGRTVYRQETNESRLMRYSGMHIGSIKTRFERLGTLLDNEFEWIRSGERGTKRPIYTLDVLEKTPMPKELAEIASKLPDLEDVAFGRVDLAGAKPTAKPQESAVEGPFTETEGGQSGEETDDPF